MATCLSYDDRHIGGVEELLHRPFVWAYFAVCAWTAAGVYRVIYGDAPPTFFGKAYLLPIVIPALFIVLIVFWLGYSSALRNGQWSYVKIPDCQFKVVQFIEDNS